MGSFCGRKSVKIMLSKLLHHQKALLIASHTCMKVDSHVDFNNFALFLKMFSKTQKKIYGNLTEKKMSEQISFTKRSDFFLHEKIWSLGKFQMLFFPQSSIETNF